MYSYAVASMVEDIRHRLNDLRPGEDQRYSDDAIRQAIIKAVRWAEPLGELNTQIMVALNYHNPVQMPDDDFLEILQIETRSTSGPQIIIPPSLWNFSRGESRPIRLTYPPTDEELVITGMLRGDISGFDSPAGSARIKIDQMVVELYSTAYLYERESQWNSPGSISSEMNRATDYRMQADMRKAQMLEEIRSVYRAVPIPEGDQPQMAPARKPAARRR